MDKVICQIWIAIFGCAAIWLVGRRESWKRWGYIFGLCSQPAWFYTAWQYEQWGIFMLSFWYTYSWAQGVYNYWYLPRNDADKPVDWIYQEISSGKEQEWTPLKGFKWVPNKKPKGEV